MTTTQHTADDYRTMAANAEQAAQDSFDRSDTDGFLSQWASGLTARKYRLQAEIADNGGRSEFPALFDLDGNLVAAKEIQGQYGVVWGVLESDDPDSRIVKWVSVSHARKAATRNANMAKKGYREGSVMAAARADIGASGTGLSGAASAYVYAKRIDGGFSRDVEIIRTEAVRDY